MLMIVSLSVMEQGQIILMLYQLVTVVMAGLMVLFWGMLREQMAATVLLLELKVL